MLVLGVDVMILLCFGCALVFASYIAASLIPLSKEEGITSIVSTAITAASMVVAYIVMAHMLDLMLGAFGW